MKLVAVLALACACSSPPAHERQTTPPQQKAGSRTITIVGTNDLHGSISRLPLFGGFVANLRAARAADGGGVLLVDAGDMFQGTLESNLGEGADIVRAYNQLGYAAAAVGNHEFDYGPEGPAVTAQSVEDDPRGALKKRASEAKFPFVVSNILDDKSGGRIKWPNMPASVLVEVSGEKIGIIGASTESTPYTTMPANFVGLKVAPPAAAIIEQARALREQGAQIIVATMHIGSKCKEVDKPNDPSSCDKAEELFPVLEALPKGLVDVVVAGHTHAAIAHRINGIAVIESYSSGRAFGRVDLRVSADGHVTAAKVYAPHDLCPVDKEGNPTECAPPPYEGKPVVADPAVQKIADEALAKAGERRKEKLGVLLAGVITKSYGTESAEGNLFCDLMLAAHPEAQVALTNGGGLRADLPAGELTYGQLFEANPFDNRFAVVDVTGRHIRKLVSGTIQRGGGIFSFGGLTAKARCKNGLLDTQITVGGKPLDDAKAYKLVTSDFLASGGDGVIGRLKLPEGSIHMTDMIIRDAMADALRKRKGTIPASFTRRLDYEGERPVSCASKSAPSTQEPD